MRAETDMALASTLLAQASMEEEIPAALSATGSRAHHMR
jgi:hypothetical protein